jgi:hypothetical protein
MWLDKPAPNEYSPAGDPITATAVDGPVAVTIRAHVDYIVWDMGDGHHVTCAGSNARGTVYQDSYGVHTESPTCGYVYQTQSDDEPDMAFRVTARSHWVAEWEGGGQTGVMETDLTTHPLLMRIGELHVLRQ